MSKAERIFQLAQEVANLYNLLQARRVGSGDRYTREVIDHLKSLVIQELGHEVTNQLISQADHPPVDFWLAEEQTILEVEFSFWSSVPVLEREVFKALLAQEAGHAVRQLVLIGDPGLAQHCEAPLQRSLIAWAELHHHLRIQIWELQEKPTP